MTEPTASSPKRPSRAPLIAAAIALAFAVAYLAYVVAKRRAITPPVIALSVLPKGSGASRPLAEGATVALDEHLDLQLTVHKPSYVYLFVIEPGGGWLAWQPEPGAKPWEPGTYAPDWESALFSVAGSSKVVAVASAKPVLEAYQWGQAELEKLGEKCPACAHSALSLTVTGTLPAERTLPDGGPIRANPAVPPATGYQ